LEAKASAEAAGEKRIGTAGAASFSARRVEDIIGKGSAVVERMPVMPPTVLLRSELSPSSESMAAQAGGIIGVILGPGKMRRGGSFASANFTTASRSCWTTSLRM
jgi:hypothetical protein